MSNKILPLKLSDTEADLYRLCCEMQNKSRKFIFSLYLKYSREKIGRAHV